MGNPKIYTLNMLIMEHPIQIDDLGLHTGRTQTHMDDLGVFLGTLHMVKLIMNLYHIRKSSKFRGSFEAYPCISTRQCPCYGFLFGEGCFITGTLFAGVAIEFSVK